MSGSNQNPPTSFLDLQPLPSELRSVAKTVVGVRPTDGSEDQGYLADLQPGPAGPPGPSGQGFVYRGTPASNTDYAIHDVVTYGGQVYVATTNFTTGIGFDPSQWTLMIPRAIGATGNPGPPGPPGPPGGGVTMDQVITYVASVLSGTPSVPVTNTRARFAQDTATAGTAQTAAALFASMTQIANASSDRTGTITTVADPTKYTWVAVLASAAGSGVRFFDGTGYGGFNGAASTSVYTGPDADPTTIHQTYTDSSGNSWNLYRSSGHSVSLTFTLS